MKRFLTTLFLCLIASAAIAESIPRGSRIATQVAPTWKVHNFYGGVLFGYDWGIQDDGAHYTDGIKESQTFQGGAVAGYLFRPNEFWGLGAEIDYMARDLGEFDLDDGLTSLRGRLGVYVAPGTFVYGTAGVSYAPQIAKTAGLDKGIVVGGGLERDVTPNIAIRAEALYYTHSDEYLQWGDESSTVGRIGLLYKF